MSLNIHGGLVAGPPIDTKILMLKSSILNGGDHCTESALCIHRLPTTDQKYLQIFFEKNPCVSGPMESHLLLLKG